MSLSPFIQFEAAGDPEEVAAVLVEGWARLVIELADEVDRREQVHLAAVATAERMDGDHPVDTMSTFQESWVANHLLLVAANQLQKWLAKVTSEDFSSRLGDTQTWRDALEHLDEARLEGAIAGTNPDAKRKNQSIGKVGGILIGHKSDGRMPRPATTDDFRQWARLVLN